LLFAFGGKQKFNALKCGGFQTIYANVKLSVCLCVGHSCSPLAANQTWQVRYQTQAHNQGKVEIIFLFAFGGKEKFNGPKCGGFDTIYANVNRTDVSVALSRAVNKYSLQPFGCNMAGCYVKYIPLFGLLSLQSATRTQNIHYEVTQ